MKSEIQVAHVHLETPLTISTDAIQVLVVENPNEFYEMVCSLDRQFDGGEGAFVFSRDGQMLSTEKCGDMIANLFDFDLNNKKILSLLHKRLDSVAFSEGISLFNELSAKTMEFLGMLAYNVPFALDYDEPLPIDYLKIAGVKFEKNYETFLEKLICYINALIELKNCEFFVFVNLKSVLDDEKLMQLYKHCAQEQVGLLLLESAKLRPLLPCEKAVIITEDLCEILENYSDM